MRLGRGAGAAPRSAGVNYQSVPRAPATGRPSPNSAGPRGCGRGLAAPSCGRVGAGTRGAGGRVTLVLRLGAAGAAGAAGFCPSPEKRRVALRDLAARLFWREYLWLCCSLFEANALYLAITQQSYDR